MDICCDGHDEVCYEESECPACNAIQEKQDEIDEHEETIQELETRIDDLEAEVKLYQEIKDRTIHI